MARSRARGATLHDAEDCVQQAALEAVERAAAPEDDDLGRWLALVARRRHIDRIRRAALERRLHVVDDHDRTAPDPCDRVADASFAAYVVRALDQLPPTTRQVVAVVAGGADLDAAAAQLGLTRRSVEAHLHRARQALRHAARIGA